MKYANIKYMSIGNGNGRGIRNFGDAFEMLAIDNIYMMMGIPKNEIIEIDLEDLNTYEGEKVILPINFLMMTYFMGKDLADMSPDIIPIFLGVTFTHTDFTDKQIQFFKKHEPIGCRDERTRDTLVSYGVDAYLNGCLAITHQKEESEFRAERKRVAFIDVPKGVRPYIPEEIQNEIEFLEHEFYVSRDNGLSNEAFKKKADERIQYYKDNIRMIVTSRFHGAVIGLALGIPVILVAENEFYKFGWLSKLLPFYTRERFQKIDWNPKRVDIDELKIKMIEVAINRIKYVQILYSDVPAIEKILSNEKRDDQDNLCYIYDAIEYIKNNWDKNAEVEYGVWGVSQNAQKLFDYISEYYPKAKLSVVYDGLRPIEFQELKSIDPNEDTMLSEPFIFVTSNSAKENALDLFKVLKKKNFFLCTLEFIQKDDL